MIPYAMISPATKEMAVLRPTRMPEPMKAGVHSMIQNQFSPAIAALL